MSTTKKVLTAIFSILIIGAFAFLITWGIINWSKVKEGMSGSGLYTQDDIQNAYEDGYNTALTDKDEYDKLINSYRETISTQNDLISQHASEAAALNNSIKDHQGQINTLNEQKAALEKQIDNLNIIKENNDTIIEELNDEIGALNYRVQVLQTSKDQNANQIAALNSQIENLQSLNAQLQETNELNLQTINGLNAQIASLNEQIDHLHTQIQTNLTAVTDLNSRITELQNSVAYYEQYIAKFETDNKVTVTFEFAGTVYNLQLVEKGSKVTVAEPTSTEYLIFNGWTVNNEPIDLSTFVVNEKVTIVADVTYRYAVKFVVEGEVKSTQIVEQGQYVDEPTKPRKTGYTFDYWTYGDAEVIFDQFPITQNVTFIAKFTRLYDVSFVYEGETLTTRRIKENATTTPYAVTSTERKVFNGWTVNGEIVSVNDYHITADTVFVADITYKYEVLFMVDGNVHNRQMVEKQTVLTVPSKPTKTDYTFEGWSLDGNRVLIINNYVITEDTTFTAIFRLSTFTIEFKNGNSVVSSYQAKEGQYLSNIPKVYDNAFAGWSTDGITIIDLSEYTVYGDETFIAVYAGVYETGTDNMLMSWAYLLDNLYFDYRNGCVMYYANTKTIAGDLILPTCVNELGNDLFTGCKTLTSVTITGENVIIGDNAFANCTNLCGVDFIGSVKIIGDNAFKGCISMNGMIIKSTPTITIGANAFSGCTSLSAVWFEIDTNEETPYINIQSNTFSNVPAYLEIYIPYDVFSVHYDGNWDMYSEMIRWY